MVTSVMADSTTIKMGGFYYPPFFYTDNDTATGIGVDLAIEICRRLDRKCEVTIYPLKRLLSNLKEGSTDGAIFLLKTADRSEYLYYSDTIMTILGRIGTRKDRNDGVIEFDSLAELKELKTSATMGYSYGETMDSLMKEMDVVELYDDYSSYKMLLHGKTDFFAGNEIVAKGLFKLHPELQGKFSHSTKSFIDWEFHLVVSKQSRFFDELPQINAILKTLHKEGYIRDLIRIYTE